ncbi:MAG TPA: DUF983 domain-containing protein [Iamia sp.]
MPVHVTPDDATRPEADWSLMLRRGLIRRCPRCGGGNLFRTWWAMRDRCPRCGVRFVREEGYFTGVYLVNFGVVLAVLFVLVMGVALWLGSHPDASAVPFLVTGTVIAVAVPVVFYPFARTIWAALDLAMTPMDLDEILDASEAEDTDDAEDAGPHP